MTARWWRPVVAAALVLGVAVGALVAPRVVRSPASLAASRAAPDLGPATAAVERRVLTATVTWRGTVTNERRVDVEALAAPGGRAVVTSVRVRPGSVVRSGRVLVEVSGRPLILLEGRLPAYRDLRAGSSGPDVVQVQAALRGLGYSVADRRGVFGTGTAAAVRHLYSDRGYEPPGGRSPGGGSLPLAEVVFLSGLPGRVDRLDTSLGATPTAALMTLSSGRAVVQGSLAPGDGGLVRAGQTATVLSEVLDRRAIGRVTSVGRLTAGSGPPGYPVVVTLGRADPRLFDRDVRVTVAAARSPGPVLVVPLSAVTARSDGSSVVEVVRAGGHDPTTVPVTLGLDTGGYVAVTPVGGELRPGERVVVGAGNS